MRIRFRFFGPRFLTASLLGSFLLSAAFAQTPAASTPAATSTPPPERPVILLWPEGAPGALGSDTKDKPSLTVYAPPSDKRNGASMLVLPGGGYSHLSVHEGRGYAEWFAEHGVTAYVLQYRLGSSGYRHPAMLNDAARALRMIRSFAKKEEGMDPSRIGIIGSSAGGHLASTLLTHFDEEERDTSDPIERESSRPTLGILCYPVISLGEFAHAGSKKNLLGDAPEPQLVNFLSNETQVTPRTPPCFIWHTVEDKTVPVENALLFASALRKAGVPFSLHIYETGAHGLGLGRPGKPAPPWADQLRHWLRERKFLPE